jgi:hypothetical protein
MVTLLCDSLATCRQPTVHTSKQNWRRVKWINMPLLSDNLSEPPTNHKMSNSDKRISMENIPFNKSFFTSLVSVFICNKSVSVNDL